MKSALLGLAASLALLAFGGATPAAAAQGDYIGGCSPTADVNPDAIACYGFTEGNFNFTDLSDVEAAFGLTGLVKIDEAILGGDSSSTIIDFGTPLSGLTVISFHWGNGNGPSTGQGGETAFYLFNLAGDTTFTQSYGSLSNAVLWKTTPCVGDCDNGGNSVPEPATWTMMIMGFGGVGAMIRRRRYSLTAV
jgi:hypothetical protein